MDSLMASAAPASWWSGSRKFHFASGKRKKDKDYKKVFVVNKKTLGLKRRRNSYNYLLNPKELFQLIKIIP